MDFHAYSLKEAIEKLNSSEHGLTKEQASERLKEFGKNKLKRTRHFQALKIFFEQFESFLIILLIIAAVISFLMKSRIDSVAIFVIIILNAGIGFFQEYKAEKAIESLKKLIVPKSKVIREGKLTEISSENIVPGDILILDEGDKIGADARIIESSSLKVNEASLTGESNPVEKISGRLNLNMPLVERTNMIYQGTQVISGSAKAIVVNTGMNTEIGRISELVQEIKSEKNPLKDKLDVFARKIGVIIILISFLITVLLIFNGSEIIQSFLVSVSLAVSAIPEGLPAVISLTLALATRKMAYKNVLIRKLPASETLGRVTVICTDKTGTLTEEKMEVVSIYTNGKINPAKEKELLLKTGVLCNKTRISDGELIGDPTEIALVISAKNNFLEKEDLEKKEPKIKEFPFTSERKIMSIVRRNNQKIISYVKGAPENLIEVCDYEILNGKKIKITELDKIRLLKVYEGMASKGLRVLGFAYKEINVLNQEVITQDSAERNLTFIGFQGMIDPPRKEVKGAVGLCHQAGIKVIMITGDSELTAMEVAKEIGLKGRSLDSRNLRKMTDMQLMKDIYSISVFSRISPQDKLRIVNILKQKNETVAMTGDGVNDALALKRADVGIAMGIRGTDVARDASDIILTDDNFASIVQGVKEGRTVYDNIKKFVKYLLTTNFAEVAIVLLVTLIWRNPDLLPLLPLQILWINLVTDSLPALALSAEPSEKNIMKRKANKQNILEGIKTFTIFGGVISTLISLLFFMVYFKDIDKARTMIVTGSVVFQMFLVFNSKSEGFVFKSPSNKYLFYAVFISVMIHVIAIYTPLNTFLSFTVLGLFEWISIFFIGVIGFFLMEGVKKLK